MSEAKRVADQLKRAFDGDAWHGPAVKEVLKGVTAAQAARHPVKNAHSIWEFVLHIAVWESFVRRRIQGEAVLNVSDEQDWPPVRNPSTAAWKTALTKLVSGHRRLHRAVAGLSDKRLSEKAPGKKTSLYHEIHGVIQHDLYHAGQIALLKKALQK